MKKIISFITVAAIASAYLTAGCEKKENTGDNSVPTLTWYVPNSQQTDAESVVAKANEIIEKEIGAKLDLIFVDASSFSEKLNMYMASGNKFDLCFTGYVNPFATAVQRGGLMELSELLETVPKLKEAVPQYYWDIATVNDGIYAVPNQQILGGSLSVVIKKDLADKYGFDVSSIRKTEDIEPFLETIKHNEPDIFPYRTNWGYGGIITADDGEYYYDLTLGIMRVVYEDGELSVKKMTECRHTLNAARKLHEWYEKGYIRKDVAVAIDSVEDLTEGKYGVWLETYKPGIVRQRKLLTGNDVYAVQIGKPFMTTGTGNGAMTGINANSEHPLESIKLLELVNTEPDILNLLTYGIEGKNYIKKSDNVAKRTDKVFSNSTWVFGNQFIIYTDSEDDENVWEETKRINNSARKSPLMGFRPDTSQIQTELAGCKELLGKYKVVGNGTIDPDTYWQDFDRDLDEAGAEKIKRVLEEQISKFLSEK